MTQSEIKVGDRHNFFFAVLVAIAISLVTSLTPLTSMAQDLLPPDNGLEVYHTQPRWRESESHPLRVVAYAVHPIGWLAREVIFRPLSFFAASNELNRSVMGFREPFDFRQPECFSADDSAPDCRSVVPFNYDKNGGRGAGSLNGADGSATQFYFPNVNFDFNKRKLNTLGLGKTKQIAELLKTSFGSVNVVLEGNADYIGSDKYNDKLGLDRAEAVKAELVKLGIPAERLSTVSFGESKPLVDEKTAAARALNRRVEVHPAEASK